MQATKAALLCVCLRVTPKVISWIVSRTVLREHALLSDHAHTSNRRPTNFRVSRRSPGGCQLKSASLIGPIDPPPKAIGV